MTEYERIASTILFSLYPGKGELHAVPIESLVGVLNKKYEAKGLTFTRHDVMPVLLDLKDRLLASFDETSSDFTVYPIGRGK